MMSVYKDRIKLPMFFNADLMKQDIENLSACHWIEHFVKQNFYGDWSIIPLRGPRGETHPIRMSYSDPMQKDFSDTDFLKLTSYFPKILSSFKCKINAARLMKLTSNSSIKEHSDFELSAEQGTLRLHIPVKTNADVLFKLNGSQVILKEGECWYLRLSDPHSVDNNGQSDRIHLVIDVELNVWLEQLLSLDVIK